MTNLLSINKIVVVPLLSANAISKSVLLIGICLLGTVPLCAQSTSKENVEAAIDAVTDQYYYIHLDSALFYYRQAAQTAKAQGWWDTYLYAVLNMAWCADNHGHIDTLRYFLNEAETTVARHREALDTSRTYPGLLSDVPYTRGVYYYATGDFAKAADAFRPIVAQPAAGLDSMLAYETYTYLGSAYYRLENYQQAVRHYEAAGRWLPRYHENFAYRERSYSQALNAMYLGQCYFAEAAYQQKEENYQPSLTLYHQALSLLSPHQEQLIYQNALVSNYHLLSDIHQRLQEYDSALYYLKEVIALSQEDRLRTHILFGNTFAAAKDYPSALYHYRKSQVLSEQKHKGKHYEKAIPLYKIGQVYARQQQWDTALTYYQQALGELVEEFAPGKDVYQNPHFKTSGAKKELLEVLLLKAEALWGQYRQDPGNTQSLLSALEVYHLMTEVVDDMRRVFPSIDYKQFLTSKFYTIYQQAIQAAYQAHQSGLPGQDFLAEAFYFSEKGKSIALLEALKNAEAEAFAGIPAGAYRYARFLIWQQQRLYLWDHCLGHYPSPL